MPKGVRETMYHIIVIGSSDGRQPADVVKIAKTAEYRRWGIAHGLQLDTDLAHTGNLYGRLRDGRPCLIVKGKTVVPVAGAQL